MGCIGGESPRFGGRVCRGRFFMSILFRAAVLLRERVLEQSPIDAETVAVSV